MNKQTIASVSMIVISFVGMIGCVFLMTRSCTERDTNETRYTDPCSGLKMGDIVTMKTGSPDLVVAHISNYNKCQVTLIRIDEKGEKLRYFVDSRTVKKKY
jgi:hypothetical protein